MFFTELYSLLIIIVGVIVCRTISGGREFYPQGDNLSNYPTTEMLLPEVPTTYGIYSNNIVFLDILVHEYIMG